MQTCEKTPQKAPKTTVSDGALKQASESRQFGKARMTWVEDLEVQMGLLKHPKRANTVDTAANEQKRAI